ncbi:DUF262 domain-containing protein [Klebsiella quasipneumoniae]|uniref:DUF262 domain-containing protein n=1 Tax=Klebsiella quasipneumoniae TaxID=1463165 RepID=UPI001FB58E85|nr:DUF262 domain-containing protein [Klebsiella quasipneumoniae]MCJ1848651.1 DUF262 domain-containing protein [Klebsiella quasipneumoniae subsp. similipneumoniae]
MFKVQNHASRTLSWWYKQRSKIDFEPEYQRKGNLWSDKDKAFLIDSIINEYDLPKVYLADFTVLNTALNAKNMSYAVIDGRQRLESIIEFYEDKIKLNNDFVLYSNPNIKIGGMTFSQIRSIYPDISEIFEEFNLDVMSVISDDESKVKDLFVRLNKSKPLTGAELRNAMEGVIPDLIRALADKKFFKESVKFNKSRGQDYNAASKVLLIEYNKGFTDTKRKNLDKFVSLIDNPDELDLIYQAAYKAEQVLDKMHSIFKEKDPLLSSSGLIPVYYELSKLNFEADDLHEFFDYFDSYLKDKENNSEIINQFKQSVRNINDQGGLSKAYSIMLNNMEHYFSNGKKLP